MTKRKEPWPLPKDMPSYRTKVAKIRWLYAQGWERGDIACTLGISYQHVFNTIDNPPKEPRER